MSRDRRDRPELVPRYGAKGYGSEWVTARRRWVEERTGSTLSAVGELGLDGESLRGNIENPIGVARVPLGVAGPLRVRGERADGTFYVPLATTEGALVRSYERGMVAISLAGGCTARVLGDENRVCPVLVFADAVAAAGFVRSLDGYRADLERITAATTRHGRLLGVEGVVTGRQVVATFRYATGDAHGMNMITRATDAACRWLVEHAEVERFLPMSGASGEKHSSAVNLAGGKGKRVVASVRLPEEVLRPVLRVDAAQMEELWRRTALGQIQAGTLGYNGQLANGLAALFIACGQDVANIVGSSEGLTVLEAVEGGALEASLHLPSLTLGTVGGGTALATARECLELLGCFGTGGARRLAEITAATLLAGEISMAAALATGEFAAAHERYGRNRPEG